MLCIRTSCLLVFTLLLTCNCGNITAAPIKPSASKGVVVLIERAELPTLIKIDGKVWTIHRVSKIEEDGVDCHGKKTVAVIYLGMTYYDREIIEIAMGQSAREEAATLMHELMHATTEDNFACKKMNGHAFIYTTSGPLAQVLIDNPNILRYFETIGR